MFYPTVQSFPTVMSFSSPSPNNTSLSSSNFFLDYVLENCFNNTVGLYIFTTFTIGSTLLLVPLCLFVFFVGHRQSRQQGPGWKMSHSDVFTYHAVAVELISVFGSTVLCCGIHAYLPGMIMFGGIFYSLNIPGQMVFHCLTGFERYLAVVHPITYRSLRTAKGMRIRDLTVCCAWLFSFAWAVAVTLINKLIFAITAFCVTVVFFLVISFCSLSVLCILTRPGPGKQGGKRQVDQSKMRAFYTILAILGLLMFRFGGNMISITLYAAIKILERGLCEMMLSVTWFLLPSRLVLPLLFLHRAGKLLCCKSKDGLG
ncbi:uncharacterized protein LOC117807007 isoform X2 [Xyrichtys novacula]|uniref:Uncharacterized protein LOC117807007 isoform X2 n=1 Tax=Xyrichtys novacula TaxID=13765 RepID=A0AAV1HLW6_XYRNO|nr:uncharacterized protein LOC117807007 isoform X2 [Xyrichtys novacula]